MMEAYIQNEINTAKERILVKLVQQIEGRLATEEDGLNFMFRSRVGHPGKEMVYYKNEFIGSFEINTEANTVTVTFTP
jgi:hypothetical protein